MGRRFDGRLAPNASWAQEQRYINAAVSALNEKMPFGCILPHERSRTTRRAERQSSRRRRPH
jgi:hypothetical protein